MIRQIRKPNCPACGAVGQRYYEGLYDNLYGVPGVWALARCPRDACRLLWLDPAPHPDDLALLYRGYHTHEAAGKRGLILRSLRWLYEILSGSLLSLFGVMAERRAARLMFVGSLHPATLIDIGCGRGDFLHAMAGRGWQVAGVDFDPEAVAYARRRYCLDVSVGTPESVNATGRKFAVVTASHVIEHVPDPVEFLRQCAMLLSVGGRIVIRTPNSDSLGHRLYGRAWRGLEPPRHLQLFTRASLSACAGKADLRVVTSRTSAAEAEDMLILSHYLKRRGAFHIEDLGWKGWLEWATLAPWLAVRAKCAWWMDRDCGEEIHMVLRQ